MKREERRSEERQEEREAGTRREEEEGGEEDDEGGGGGDGDEPTRKKNAPPKEARRLGDTEWCPRGSKQSPSCSPGPAAALGMQTRTARLLSSPPGLSKQKDRRDPSRPALCASLPASLRILAARGPRGSHQPLSPCSSPSPASPGEALRSQRLSSSMGAAGREQNRVQSRRGPRGQSHGCELCAMAPRPPGHSGLFCALPG